MSNIAARRCFNHAQREAAARCSSCEKFYCRECIAEHDGRMTCSRCLMPGEAPRRKGRLLSWALRAFLLFSGTIVLWLAFFLLGELLLNLPSSFHEGIFSSIPEGNR